MNYQLQLEKIIENKENHGKTLLIHSCCGPCSSYILEYLGEYFKIIVFYYNPNIYPYKELELRIKEQKKVIDFLETKYPIELMVEEGEPKDFYKSVKAYKDLEEGSLRCYECYKLRLKRAAKIACDMNCDYYTTTLSISPYKNVQWLNDLTEELKLGDVKALPSDFKKKAGFQRSIELSNDMDLYRQDYCGCVYSMIEKEERDQERMRIPIKFSNKYEYLELDKSLNYLDVKFATLGLIDVHTNGGFGVNITGASLEELDMLKLSLAKNGITGFVPTIITDDLNIMKESLKRVVKSSRRKNGSKIFGIFMEGPFISKEKRGAHPKEYILLPQEEIIKEFINLAEDLEILIGLAPELKNAINLIEKYKDKATFGLGHSMANFDETNDALKNGAQFFIHLMNTMKDFHHRDPGILGRAFLEEQAFIEFIGDGFHLKPGAINFIKKNFKIEQLLLVSDSSPLGGLKEGEMFFGDDKILLKDNSVFNNEGIIAGSAFLLSDMVEYLIEKDIFSLEEIIQMTHKNSLKHLNFLEDINLFTLWNSKGKIIGSKIEDKFYLKY